MDYLSVEKRHVVAKRGLFSFGSGGWVEEKRPPVVVFQVWDNDTFSADDFLGEFRLDLTALPAPAKSAAKCRPDILPEVRRKLNEEKRKKKKMREMEEARKAGSGDGRDGHSFLRKCFPFVRRGSSSSSSYSLLRDEATSAEEDDDDEEKNDELINLFEQKRVKGFFPFVAAEKANDDGGGGGGGGGGGSGGDGGGGGGGVELAGKLEVELEVMSASEASARPAGKGREEPNENPRLDPPKRPETSFLWIASPWKSLKHVVWKKFRGFILKGILLAFVVVFILLLLYSLPETINKKIWGV